jgi:CubicO group peptidase (beta-lactamase class C family)
MDGERLDAMLANIRAAELPIDSVTVVRHGYVVLDARFGRFASGRLGEPYASGRLHELQSATKSVSSMLLGIALRRSGATVRTTLVKLAAAADYVPGNIDARKRAITLEDLLTMQSGLAEGVRLRLRARQRERRSGDARGGQLDQVRGRPPDGRDARHHLRL